MEYILIMHYNLVGKFPVYHHNYIPQKGININKELKYS